MPGARFEDEITRIKAECGVTLDTELDAEALRELTRRFGAFYDFPADPREQLEQAINAVFDSWMGERAIAYRRIQGIPYDCGTAVTVQQMVYMIELPRACFVAGEIARHAEFFSFGTNDLTQTALGFSRDDIESRVVPHYKESGIVERSPFARIDEEGVGELVRMAVERGRAARPGLVVGICGEHGGDPDSIRFCHTAGLDYVSCSPFRVPIARVAAAQAALGD